MSKKRYPSREEIQKFDDRPWEDVPTPELGVDAHVRVGTMRALDLVSIQLEGLPKEQWPGLVLSRCCLDPDTGERRFLDEDAAWLNEKSCMWMGNLWKAAVRLNGLAVDDTAKK